MHFFEELIKRGLVQDYLDIETMRTLRPGDSFYVGFDPTAPSLQIGNLVPLMMVVRLGKLGLRPIILFGGATGAIGDPSGKNEERQLLDRSVIDQNIETQTRQVEELLAREGVEASFVNNFDWTKGVDVLTFLRDVGKHFTVNYMIAKETVKTRLSGEGISYTEFSYMLLQAFDFLHLFQNHNCRMQIGGSDQWGNITAGLELIRKKIQKEALAFSIPLITNNQGKKFGKTEQGTLWLDASRTSPYTFHQFWLNTEDADVINYIRIFTLLSENDIETYANQVRTAPEKREAQKFLADSVTSLAHGENATVLAKKSADVLFGGSVEGMSDAELLNIFADVPSKEISRTSAGAMTFPDLLAESGAVKSKGEARRLISGGGVYINSIRLEESPAQLKETPHISKNLLVVRTGKKNYTLVKLT